MTVGTASALLCDRDGTLIEDVPYNGDPTLVRPLSGVARGLDRARAAGLMVGVVTNQSGLARGRFDRNDLDAVHGRLHELLGPFDVVVVCPHGPDDGCHCRKPAPGLVLHAARALGLAPAACVVIGDQLRDVEAARRAGAPAILVGGQRPRRCDVPAAAGFDEAVDLVLGHR
jgi:histidinol-phosphate phosphatase family protein